MNTILNSKSVYFGFVCILSFLTLSCLDSGNSSDSENKTPGLSAYVGEWFYIGVEDNEEKTLTIYDTLEYRQVVDVYEDVIKQEGSLNSNRVIEGTITHISENEHNSDFDSIYIKIGSVSVKAESAQQATAWNNTGYGGVSNWNVGETKVFDENTPGGMDDEAIWKSNILIAVKREGDLLEVNERAGFDGNDPEHQVYFIK